MIKQKRVQTRHGCMHSVLYRLMDALDTDANTILGIKEKDEESVDERLKELSPKMKETLKELFLKTIDGVEKI